MATDKTPELILVSVRLEADLVRRLRRVCADRSVDRIEPYTQQDVIAVALEEWIGRNEKRGSKR